MLVSTVLSLYHAAVSPARACDLAEGRVGLSIARADGARGARRKTSKKMKSMRLAYSTTSSPPSASFLAPQRIRGKRDCPCSCERSPDS